MLEIGITLRKYRNRHKYSQQYVANILGISRVAYMRWENNKIDFAVSQLYKVSEFYEITIEEIIHASYVRKKLS